MRNFAFFLSLVLVFSIPWEESVTIFGGEWTLTKGIGLITAAVWLGLILKDGFRKPHHFHIIIFIFIMWNIASVLWSVEVDVTIKSIQTYIQLGIMVWILWDLYTTKKALKALLQAYILGAYVSIGSTIINYLSGKEAFIYSGGRYAAKGFNPNDMGLILALGIPVAWYLAVSESSIWKIQWLRLVNYFYIPAAIIGILLTASRGSLIAAVPAIFFIIMSTSRFRPVQRSLILLTLGVSIFAIQPMIPMSNIQRLSSIPDSVTKSDLGGRVRLWRISVATFSEHPLLGVGSGSMNTSRQLGSQVHNTYLSVLTELGLIGFSFFIFMLVIVVYHAAKQPKILSGLWISVFTVWTIGSFVHTWESTKATWLFLNLVVISDSVLIKWKDSENSSAEQSAVLVKKP